MDPKRDPLLRNHEIILEWHLHSTACEHPAFSLRAFCNSWIADGVYLVFGSARATRSRRVAAKEFSDGTMLHKLPADLGLTTVR